MKVKITNITRVEQRIRAKGEVAAIAAGKSRILDLDQADFEAARRRTSLDVQEMPVEVAADEKPSGKKAKATS